jgi:hypothetical protein
VHRDRFFGQAVSQILAIGIRAQVLEWQDGDRHTVGRARQSRIVTIGFFDVRGESVAFALHGGHVGRSSR